MDIGVFFPVEPELRSASDNLSMLVDIGRQCEELGYSSMWVASRHLSPSYAALPSPLVLLAAAAAGTSRIRLGSSLVALPLENVMRLAEDFATLDAVCSGRGRLGVGSGDDPSAFKAFGSDFDRRQAETSSRVPTLLEILQGSEVGGLQLYPPVDQVPQKVALGAQSARGAAWAGSLGVGLLQGRSEPKAKDPTASQARAAGAYRQIHPNGSVITARNLWVGGADDDLLAEGMARYDIYLRSRGRDPLPSSRDEALNKMNIICGAPEQLVAEVRARVSPIQPDELLITVDPGGLPRSDIETRLAQLSKAFQLGSGV